MNINTIQRPQSEGEGDSEALSSSKPTRTDYQRSRQKEYSRLNRRRKKEYFKKLEEKVKSLEEEVKRLNIELWKERNQAKTINTDFIPAATEIITSEAIIRDTVMQKNEETIDKFFQEDLKQIVERTLPKEEGWLNQLKYHFDAITESIFMSPHKAIFFISQNLSGKSSHSYKQVGKYILNMNKNLLFLFQKRGRVSANWRNLLS